MKGGPPLFSIVTVCLNAGADLLKTSASVCLQDFVGFQHIIKDGGSEDGSERLTFPDPRVVFVSDYDAGIYDAMNRALSLCKGRYVNFLNAGDTFRGDNVLSMVAGFIEEHAYPDMVYVDRYNEKLGAVTQYPSSLSPWYLFRRPVCHQAIFVKRSALAQIGGFDTSFHILADYDVLLKLALEKRLRYAHCPIVGVNYKDDGVSSDRKNRRQKLNEVKRLRETHFTGLQRLFYGVLWRATMPGIRIRLVEQDRIRWLRRLFLS